MKQLIFLDNDSGDRTEEEARTARRRLRLYAGLPEKYLSGMKIISDFRSMDQDEAFKLIYESDCAIVTWSMYTFTHYNSLGQLLRFLRTAGISQVKNRIYLDTSGNLPKDLGRELKDTPKEMLAILNAIEQNFIISFDYDDPQFPVFRVRTGFKGLYESPFKKEKVNLKKLLQ